MVDGGAQRILGLALAFALAFSASPGFAATTGDGVVPTELPTFDPVFQNDSAVRAVVARLGLPDRAEVVPLSIDEPWVASELRAYYLANDHMLVFMRARTSGGDVSFLRYQGPIPPDLRRVASGAPAGGPSNPDRIAAEAEARAEAAERAADRAEWIAEGMAKDFERSLVKK